MRRVWSRLRHGRSGTLLDRAGMRSRGFAIGFGIRELAGLMAASLVALVWFSEADSLREVSRARILAGEPGTQTMALAFSSTREILATTDAAGRVAIRRADGGRAIESFLPFEGVATRVAFSADGHLLAVAGIEPGVVVFDLNRTRDARPTRVPVGRIKALAFSPDGRTLAMAGDAAGTIVLWDPAAGRARMSLNHPAPVRCLAFSSDGRRLAAGGKDDRPAVTIWDLECGRHRVRPGLADGPIMAVAFSVDGTMIATSSAFERSVRIWDTDSLRLNRILDGHAFGTSSIAFSPDGMTMATAGNDGMVRLWSVTTGRQTALLDGDASSLGCIAYSADGQMLVAMSRDDNDIRLWDLADSPSDSRMGSRRELSYVMRSIR